VGLPCVSSSRNRIQIKWLATLVSLFQSLRVTRMLSSTGQPWQTRTATVLKLSSLCLSGETLQQKAECCCCALVSTWRPVALVTSARIFQSKFRYRVSTTGFAREALCKQLSSSDRPAILLQICVKPSRNRNIALVKQAFKCSNFVS